KIRPDSSAARWPADLDSDATRPRGAHTLPAYRPIPPSKAPHPPDVHQPFAAIPDAARWRGDGAGRDPPIKRQVAVDVRSAGNIHQLAMVKSFHPVLRLAGARHPAARHGSSNSERLSSGLVPGFHNFACCLQLVATPDAAE